MYVNSKGVSVVDVAPELEFFSLEIVNDFINSH